MCNSGLSGFKDDDMRIRQACALNKPYYYNKLFKALGFNCERIYLDLRLLIGHSTHTTAPLGILAASVDTL